MNITVYCGAAPSNNPSFEREARALGTWMAQEGHTLVWGCGDTGLMGAVSEGVLENGGRAIGIIPRFLQEWEKPHPSDFDGRLVREITEEMTTRRLRMIELGEVFVALPGGTGTLEELSEVTARMKFDEGVPSLILMNVDGFYDPLIAQFDAFLNAGLMTVDVRRRILSAANAAEVVQLLS